MATVLAPDLVARVRAQFPSLASGEVYLENAGGSQVPGVVADAIRDFMLTSYVQAKAGYPASRRAGETFDKAHEFADVLMNASGKGRTILGASSSQLFRMIADCYAEVLKPGDEIVIADTGHEANISPWVRLEKLGAVVKWWRTDRETWNCPLGELEKLLGPRTKLVAIPHVSNLLGAVVDVAAVTRLAHAAGARVVVDGVAYAPHLAVDVSGWDVDWYGITCYKIFGPHMGLLNGKADAWEELSGPGHFFIPRSHFPTNFELGCQNYEGCAGILALGEYLRTIADRPDLDPHSRACVEAGFQVVKACEAPLTAMLVDYLKSKPSVSIVGPPTSGPERVGTVSFVHERLRPAEIVAETDRAGIGIRYGHMYAYRLCETLGIDPEEGVVRVSLAHYNTPEELGRLFGVLDGVL